MASRGVDETARMKASIEKQLNRLLVQLEDLEEFRGELDDDEYEETKAETMEQLREFEASLEALTAGDMTLVSDLNSVQLAIQGAIREAFRTPDVIKMFAKREPGALRAKLASLREDRKLGRISEASFASVSVECILALQKMGEPLSAPEQEMLSVHHENSASFVKQTGDGRVAREKLRL